MVISNVVLRMSAKRYLREKQVHIKLYLKLVLRSHFLCVQWSSAKQFGCSTIQLGVTDCYTSSAVEPEVHLELLFKRQPRAINQSSFQQQIFWYKYARQAKLLLLLQNSRIIMHRVKPKQVLKTTALFSLHAVSIQFVYVRSIKNSIFQITKNILITRFAFQLIWANSVKYYWISSRFDFGVVQKWTSTQHVQISTQVF
ncbi:Hypothetical_protein [Hexamita inflata]|uniref:Hypothetical_protein n=1 Tax=Hexamita inflata TaxID=28002 RepID=A0AA86PQ16_9EUKA|nr:Hypothetical protein HINF_LOCUS26677 [Hexamita inflata]CAI9939033.1 Hypothetical protein HINF_LOCUS26678 [Hexamita inflata]CAI9939034.1 Hypothetical protein HINF_LOCUS26679 [Hexamita inflata]